MLYRSEREKDGSISLRLHVSHDTKQGTMKNEPPHDYLSEIDDSIESLGKILWPLNKFIHDNPELAFKEYKAHEALTSFMQSQEGWEVTTSAYGIETAWVASYGSGEGGPVVSFNAEFGTSNPVVNWSIDTENVRRPSKSRPCLWPQFDRNSLARCRPCHS